jgi:hypothetical protein
MPNRLYRLFARALGTNVGEPAVRILAPAVDEVEETLLNLRRDRPAFSAPDRDSIDAAHGRHL